MKTPRTKLRILLPDQSEIAPCNPRQRHHDPPVRFEFWIEARKFRRPLERLKAMGSSRFFGLLPCDLATLSLHEQAVSQQVELGIVGLVSHSRTPREASTVRRVEWRCKPAYRELPYPRRWSVYVLAVLPTNISSAPVLVPSPFGRHLSSHQCDHIVSGWRRFRQQSHARDVVDGMLGDVLRIMLFDHRDAGVVQRRHQPDRYISQQHADDA